MASSNEQEIERFRFGPGLLSCQGFPLEGKERKRAEAITSSPSSRGEKHSTEWPCASFDALHGISTNSSTDSFYIKICYVDSPGDDHRR